MMEETPVRGATPRALGTWIALGLVPALLDALVMFPTVTEGEDPAFGELGLLYVMGMPGVALLYLLAIVLIVPVLRLPDGRALSKPLYVCGMLALNVLLWLGGCAVVISRF